MPVLNLSNLHFQPAFTIPGGGARVLYGEEPIPVMPTQEEVWSFTRFHLELPIEFEEQELEKRETTDVSVLQYANEAEATEVFNSKGGRPFSSEHIEPPLFESPYQKVATSTALTRNTVFVTTTTKVITETSTIPIAITVAVQLLGSEGVLWSSAIEAPIRYAGKGNPGGFYGSGIIDDYVDLVNPITVLSGQPLKARFLVSVPSSVVTRVNLGLAIENGNEVFKPGAMQLFYDPLPRSDYPLKRGGAR